MSASHELKPQRPSQELNAQASASPNNIRRALLVLFALIGIATFSALRLVKLRSRLVSLAYETQKAKRDLKIIEEKFTQLRVKRAPLLSSTTYLERLAARHGYRAADDGQIVAPQNDPSDRKPHH
jgi:beta-lactamase regulating signal transducer with metallopeptidase domain